MRWRAWSRRLRESAHSMVTSAFDRRARSAVAADGSSDVLNSCLLGVLMSELLCCALAVKPKRNRSTAAPQFY